MKTLGIIVVYTFGMIVGVVATSSIVRDNCLEKNTYTFVTGVTIECKIKE